MIFVRHHQRGPDGAASWRQDELRSRDLVFVRSRYEGAHRDESFSPEHAVGCSSIRFVLGGPMVARVGDGTVDLRGGQLHLAVTHGTTAARTLTPTSDVLFIGWRGGSNVGAALSNTTRLQPSPSTVACLRRLADALEMGRSDLGGALAAADEALASLRSEGLPFHASASAVVACAANDAIRAQRVAIAVERSLDTLGSQPTASDVSRALGVCEPHALRCANRYFRDFYMSQTNWRDYLRRRRLDLGAFFMGQQAARTEDVARVLGFRSPTSFCHAFQAAGLPSPGEVQRRLLAS